MSLINHVRERSVAPSSPCCQTLNSSDRGRVETHHFAPAPEHTWAPSTSLPLTRGVILGVQSWTGAVQHVQSALRRARGHCDCGQERKTFRLVCRAWGNRGRERCHERLHSHLRHTGHPPPLLLSLLRHTGHPPPAFSDIKVTTPLSYIAFSVLHVTALSEMMTCWCWRYEISRRR